MRDFSLLFFISLIAASRHFNAAIVLLSGSALWKSYFACWQEASKYCCVWTLTACGVLTGWLRFWCDGSAEYYFNNECRIKCIYSPAVVYSKSPFSLHVLSSSVFPTSLHLSFLPPSDVFVLLPVSSFLKMLCSTQACTLLASSLYLSANYAH